MNDSFTTCTCRDFCWRCTDLELASALAAPRLERAIGVLYLPETKRASHYFHAQLPEQFDFVLHVDETRAVELLERNALWEAAKSPRRSPRVCETSESR